MKRAIVFLLLCPASVATAWLIYFVESGGASSAVAEIVTVLLFCFTLCVAVIAWFIDGSLASSLPLVLRAPLTAIAGGVTAGVLFLISAFPLLMNPFAIGMMHGANVWTLPLWLSAPFAIGGALCMGVCSLLSHDYGRRQRPAVQSGGLPSNAG